MREYIYMASKELDKVRCNHCGKELEVVHGIVKEGVFSMDMAWGYFSEKDGQIHSFDLCEECYDYFVSQFQVPITVEDQKELI
jgi:hypothetical protein